MQIELIGCTGSGKSTLLSAICRVAHEQAREFVTKDEFLLRLVGLNGISSQALRKFCVDVVAAIACVANVKQHWQFYRFASRIIFRPPASWFEKLNLFRNVLKKLGVFDTIRRFCPPGMTVVVDEGTLQAAHNLFVHLRYEPTDDDFRSFFQLVPLPEVAISVQQELPVLVGRALRRRHRRLRDADERSVKLFLDRAVSTFDRLESEPAIGQILLVADMSQRAITCNPEAGASPSLRFVATILRCAVSSLAQGAQFQVSSARS